MLFAAACLICKLPRRCFAFLQRKICLKNGKNMFTVLTKCTLIRLVWESYTRPMHLSLENAKQRKSSKFCKSIFNISFTSWCRLHKFPCGGESLALINSLQMTSQSVTKGSTVEPLSVLPHKNRVDPSLAPPPIHEKVSGFYWFVRNVTTISFLFYPNNNLTIVFNF